MSHHEGVSCDSCLKANFRGKRYKCLVCFDYDLCATCFENGATSTRHNAEHAMQCILTRADIDLFYGGESVTTETPQAFTCPFCSRMGFTEPLLQEHVNADHMDAAAEVVCPICASVPAGEPNNVTDDFATHLQAEHRSAREMVYEEPQTAIRGRRAPHPTRSMNTTRARRSQMQYSSSSGLSALSPSSRESMDPIAELLSQLSGVRRAANLGQSHSQLQQLQMQLQLDRHSNGVINVNNNASAPTLSARQPFGDPRTPIERVIRRHQQSSSGMSSLGSTAAAASGSSASAVGGQVPYVVLMEPSPSPATGGLSGIGASGLQSTAFGLSSGLGTGGLSASSVSTSRFLLSRCNESNGTETEQQAVEVQKADKSLFVQELLLTTLTDYMSLNEKDETTSAERGAEEEDVHLSQRQFGSSEEQQSSSNNRSNQQQQQASDRLQDSNNSENNATAAISGVEPCNRLSGSSDVKNLFQNGQDCEEELEDNLCFADDDHGGAQDCGSNVTQGAAASSASSFSDYCNLNENGHSLRQQQQQAMRSASRPPSIAPSPLSRTSQQQSANNASQRVSPSSAEVGAVSALPVVRNRNNSNPTPPRLVDRTSPGHATGAIRKHRGPPTSQPTAAPAATAAVDHS